LHTFDYHIHTANSPDSDAPVAAVVDGAISAGLTEIAITDHCDFTWPQQDILNPYFDLDKYRDEIRHTREKYRGRINVLFGLELGIRPDLGQVIDEIIDSYKFDFLIGSMHDIMGVDFYVREFLRKRPKKQAYEEYFELLLASIKACDFDVLGHMDYLVRYADYSDPVVHYADFAAGIDAVLRELIALGRGMEINTSGYAYGQNQPHPNFSIIRRFYQLGGEIITIGSDAHSPSRLAQNFNNAVQLVKEAGFTHFATFSEREIKMVKFT